MKKLIIILVSVAFLSVGGLGCAQEYIYVCDYIDKVIHKITIEGDYVASIGQGYLVGPIACDFDSKGNLLVGDADDSIKVFKDDAYLTTFGTEFQRNSNYFAVASNGYIYTSLNGRGYVAVYDSNYRVVGTFDYRSILGSNIGTYEPYDGPRGIAYDPVSGNLIFTTSWAAYEDKRFFEIKTNGDIIGEFGHTSGYRCRFNTDGFLFVKDIIQFSEGIRIYDTNRQEIKIWLKNKVFNRYGLAFDKSGRIYVTMSTAQINVYPSYETEIPCKVITAEQINASTIMGIAIKTETELPIANAGIDQTIHSGTQVILDGSGSTDPDGNYPLTYAWEIVSKPAGSAAILSDPAIVNPTFIADLPGDYSIQLTVTNSLESSSAPATVTVSTLNTPPVADAGEDQAVTAIGSVVQLNGSGSWDDDGDSLAYAWSIQSAPDGSSTALSDPASAIPTFVPDVYGDYIFELVVTDPWVASSPDTVKISFNNIKPVADAGGNHSTVVGNTVHMNGGGSYDANNDPLTYEWSMVTKPEGSMAELTDIETVQKDLTPDLPGSYVVSLVVNDGYIDSDPNNITITAISVPDATTDLLQETSETTNKIDPIYLKNEKMVNALTSKINAALEKIDQGLYEEALDQLKNDVLKKTNGCAETGEPDKNDWIEDCVTQDQVYPLILEAIERLESLI